MKRPSILIVDDEAQNRKVLANTLNEWGYSIILADDGLQTLELLKTKTPHLILLDIMMPGMDGFEVCQKIKADPNTKDIPIIFLTAHTDTDKVVKGFQLGAVDYITKPFNSAELIPRVQTHIKLKATEEQLIQKIQELETANRTKSEFLATMSHEIRTPMNGIIGLTQLAQKTRLTFQQQDYLTKIDSLTHVLLDIINDILDFSKIEAGKLNVEHINFSLEEVLNKLFNTFSLKIEDKGLTLYKNISSDIPRYLIGDPLRLLQILMNLTGNALKFTEKGKILIAVNVIKKDDTFITLKFSVQDTGIGIPSEIKEHLFKAFTQADNTISRKYGGTGLGLAICKCLVTMMEGDIWIDSIVGEGSTFNFTAQFKCSSEQECSKQQAQTKAVPSINTLHGARILLVEDNLINQQVARESLESEGLVVKIANNGQEAITAVTNNSFDVVLMDIQMPEMDGYEATQIIRKNQYTLPIVAMTAHAMNSVREKCLLVGMNDYITKPIDLELLFSILKKWIKPKSKPYAIQKHQKITGELPNTLPGFELKSAIKRLGGNKSLFKMLLHDFERDYAHAAIDLRSALEHNEIETALILSHTLKGIAGNLSANELQKALSDLERALKRDNFEDVLMDNVEISLIKVLESIKTIPQENQKDLEIEDTQSIPLDISIVTPLLINLHQMIEKHNVNAAHSLTALSTAMSGTGFSTELHHISDCLNRFDFSSTKKSLNIIAKRCNIKL